MAQKNINASQNERSQPKVTPPQGLRQIFTLIVLAFCAACSSGHDPGEADLIQAIAKARPAVIRIVGESVNGSGFIIDSSGLVLTSAHIADSPDLVAVLPSDERHAMTVIHRDEEMDLAIARISITDAPYLSLRKSGATVGETVLALGNPFGVGVTASAGIISARGEDIGRPGLVLTDAAINPGNSGGPLIDENGEVIGMVSARTAYGTGLGFAVGAGRLREFIAASTPDPL